MNRYIMKLISVKYNIRVDMSHTEITMDCDTMIISTYNYTYIYHI